MRQSGSKRNARRLKIWNGATTKTHLLRLGQRLIDEPQYLLCVCESVFCGVYACAVVVVVVVFGKLSIFLFSSSNEAPIAGPEEESFSVHSSEIQLDASVRAVLVTRFHAGSQPPGLRCTSAAAAAYGGASLLTAASLHHLKLCIIVYV